MLLDQGQQLGIELGELGRQEPDPGGDGLQAEHRQTQFHRCSGWCLQLLDPVELDGQGTTAQLRAELFGCDHD